MPYSKFSFQFTVREGNFTENDLLALTRLFSDNTEARLIETPGVEYDKSDPLTIGHLVIAVAASTIPVLTQLIFQWHQTRKIQDIEIEVSKGNRSIKVKARKGQEEYMAELTKQMQILLEDTSAL